jgi:hypothetical protein
LSYLPGQNSNHDPPDLSLPSRWGYSCESPSPASDFLYDGQLDQKGSIV